MGLIGRVVMMLVAGAVLAGCDCPQIKQQVFIAPPDPALQPLIDECRRGVPTAEQSCATPAPIGTSNPDNPVQCGCRRLCLRVLELIDQFSGSEMLLECRVKLPAASGAGGAGGAGGSGAGGAGGQGGTSGVAPPPATRSTTVEVDVTYRPSTCG